MRDPTVPMDRSLRLVIGAMLLCLFLSAVDQTIVATALPTIAGELGGLDQISWVVTSYMLLSTVSVPLVGKLSDVYGRKLMIQITIVAFLVGSVLAGLSQSMLQLILARGVQGIGGGGIMAMAFTVLADVMTPRQRSRYTGLFTAVFATASVVGPLLGGFIADNLSWRWVFWIKLPLGAAAFVVTALHLHLPRPTGRRSVDFLGAALLTVGVTTVLLATTWGGQNFPWGSLLIVGLLSTGVATTGVFIWHQIRTDDPVLPMRLFRDRIFVVCVTMGALLGSVLVGGVTFLPLFLQVVDGASATSSGLLLVPLMAGVVIGSNVTGRLVSRSGHYRKFPIIGLAMAVIGVSTMATIDVDTGRLLISISMGVLGLGVGFSMPVLMVAVQNAAAFPDMGVATSAVNFFRTLGSAFGVALFGTVVRVRLNATLEQQLPGSELAEAGGDLLGSPSAIRDLPTEQFDAVAAGIASGVGMVFIVAVPVVIVAFVLAWFLEEIPLRDELAPAAPDEGDIDVTDRDTRWREQ